MTPAVPMRECCQAVIDWYHTLYPVDVEGVALFCKVCKARILFSKGEWIYGSSTV